MTLFREFFNICLMRRAPQDLPASITLLMLTLLISAAGSVLIAVTSLSLPRALLSALLELAFMGLAVYGLLAARGFSARWLQTLTAMAGTNAVLLILALPLLVWVQLLQANTMDATLPVLLFYGIIIWHVMILGHIFRHALSTLLPLGVVVALLYYTASIVVINWLIPVPAAN